nr:aldehyde dehydrogenase family protein [Acidithrix sp. C25]
MAYQTVNPYTNKLVQSFPYASDAEIDAAIL